jgi:hypothetical protein
MNAPHFSSNLALAKRRARRRRSSAGGTMFVVAMTLAVLSTIGAWALQSAALEVRMAGFERQSTQTHYLAEYGVLTALENLTSTSSAAYGSLMAAKCGASNGTSVVHPACLSVPCVNFSTNPPTILANCAEVNAAYPSAMSCGRWDTASGIAGFPVAAQNGITPWTAALLDPGSGGVAGTAGSLGATNTQGNVAAELTDLVAGPPPTGTSSQPNGGTPTVASYWVTVTAYGQTYTSNSGVTNATSQGTELLRSRLLVNGISPLGQCAP